MLWPHDQELGVYSLTLICLGAYYQKYTHAEIKNLQKEMAEAVEKHQKDLMEQVQKHQRELADALAARQQEHAHRERLEKQLACQQQELAHCEKHKKDNVNSAQPQHHQREVHPNTLLSNTLMLLKYMWFSITTCIIRERLEVTITLDVLLIKVLGVIVR
jgi:hypothetical protein